MGPLVSLAPHKGPLILSLAHPIFHCSPSIYEILLASFQRSLKYQDYLIVKYERKQSLPYSFWYNNGPRLSRDTTSG